MSTASSFKLALLRMFAPQTEIYFIAQDHTYVATNKKYLRMHSVSNVSYSVGHFAKSVLSWLREWHL